MTCCLMTFTLKYEHVSVVEAAPDGSSGNTPTFEVEIKGVLKVTIESHLKMHMICLAYFSVRTLWMAPSQKITPQTFLPLVSRLMLIQ